MFLLQSVSGLFISIYVLILEKKIYWPDPKNCDSRDYLQRLLQDHYFKLHTRWRDNARENLQFKSSYHPKGAIL